MEEIDKVTKIIIGLCGGGGVLRVIILFIRMGLGQPEEVGPYKKKIKNTIIFIALAISAFSIKEILLGYYS